MCFHGTGRRQGGPGTTGAGWMGRAGRLLGAPGLLITGQQSWDTDGENPRGSRLRTCSGSPDAAALPFPCLPSPCRCFQGPQKTLSGVYVLWLSV